MPWQRTAFLHPCVEAEDTHHVRFYRKLEQPFLCSIGFTLNVGLE